MKFRVFRVVPWRLNCSHRNNNNNCDTDAETELYRGKWKKTKTVKSCDWFWSLLYCTMSVITKVRPNMCRWLKCNYTTIVFFIIVAQLDHIIGTNACCVLLIFCLFACPLLCLFKLVSVESIVRWSSVSLGAQFEPTSPWLNESGRKSKSNKKKEKPCQQRELL